MAGPDPRGSTTVPAPGDLGLRSRAAMLALVALLLLLDESTAWTFRGGILGASLATTLLVLGVVDRPGPLRSVLDRPALR